MTQAWRVTRLTTGPRRKQANVRTGLSAPSLNIERAGRYGFTSPRHENLYWSKSSWHSQRLACPAGESPYGHRSPGAAHLKGARRSPVSLASSSRRRHGPAAETPAIRPPVNAAGLASMSMASSALASIYVTGVTELLRSVWPGQVAEASPS